MRPYVRDARLYVDAKIYAGPDKSPIELVHNQVKNVSGKDCDVNFDKEAMEAVDADGQPMFQLVYDGIETLSISGVFVTGIGVMVIRLYWK